MISAEEEVNSNGNGLPFDNALKTVKGIDAHINPALSPAESQPYRFTGLVNCAWRAWFEF